MLEEGRNSRMEEMYAPPFRMTEEITNLVIEIGECVGKISVSDAATKDPKLRRVNRMQTIHATLAIEQNALTLEQVTAVIQGKRVLAPPQDICEVKNAYEAYEHMREFDPYSMEDLLKAHRFMMRGLVEEAGCLRTSNVGVYAQDRLVHMAPPAERVGDLMRQLFRWLRTSRLHPLVKSCIFHYELEFIHPFADGNGRMGRLWHCLILQRWQPFFAYLPIETLIHEKQEGYSGKEAHKGWYDAQSASIVPHIHRRDEQRPYRCRHHYSGGESQKCLLQLLRHFLPHEKHEGRAEHRPHKGDEKSYDSSVHCRKTLIKS